MLFNYGTVLELGTTILVVLTGLDNDNNLCCA